jgi:hypothetical protein
VIAMTRTRVIWVVVLVAALAALGSSLAWAATRGDHGRWDMMSYGQGMMGYAARDNGRPVGDLRQARREAEHFASRLDLRVGEVMRFTDGFYAELQETDGAPATEVLIDARTGAVWFEYGPAMMWNTRYGMMRGGTAMGMGDGSMMGWMMGRGGMMGGGAPTDPAWNPGGAGGVERRVDGSGARRIAQRWLDANRTGLRAGEPETFPGYYTLHVERAGRIDGMLSVNAFTGAAWYHWWHGRFVAMDG